jgi:hypothetical protein
MSRPSSTAPLTSTLTGLQARANDIEDILDHSPRQWFEKARHEADKAVLAERSGKAEDMFVAYVRTCTTYSRVKLHPNWKEEKSRDPQLAARVKDFMEVGPPTSLGRYSVLILDIRGVPTEGQGRQGEDTPQAERWEWDESAAEWDREWVCLDRENVRGSADPAAPRPKSDRAHPGKPRGPMARPWAVLQIG